MAYLALYRAWRPRTFEEVVGQESIVRALKNAVTDNKVAHAYLFSGPRGTGKTSMAKIIAKALNCEQPVAGEPCNQCSSCKDINQGSFMDVIEIDAASNRGIDEIRDLREKVRIAPAQGKTKVYIIDEVHMLTTEAFNALLKTIEEPPPAVVFILATTELQKIPATIRSRCQSFGFRRLTTEEIIERLQKVAGNQAIELEEAAGALIARRANGGLRDALSILDQVQAYRGSQISKQAVVDTLGLVDDLFLAQLVDAALKGDAGVLVEKINEALMQGKEAGQIAREASYYLRDLLLYSQLGKQAGLQIASLEALTYLDEQKKQVQTGQLIEALRIMMEAADRLRFSEGNKILLEIAFLQIANLFHFQKAKAVEDKPVQAARAPRSGQEKKEKEQGKDQQLWAYLLAGVKEQKIPTHALLSQGKLLGLKEDILYVGFRKGYKFHKERLEEKGNREIVENVLKQILKRDVKLELLFLDEEQHNDIIVRKAKELFGDEIVEIIE